MRQFKESSPADLKREKEEIAAEMKAIEAKKQIESPKVRPANAPRPKKETLPAHALKSTVKPTVKPDVKPEPEPALQGQASGPSSSPSGNVVSGEAMPEIVYPGK